MVVPANLKTLMSIAFTIYCIIHCQHLVFKTFKSARLQISLQYVIKHMRQSKLNHKYMFA